MKRSVLLVFVIFMMHQNSQAQLINLGLKLGVSSFDFSNQEITISNFGNDFEVAINEAHYGVYGGLFMHVNLGPLLLNPEVAISSVKVDYELRDFNLSDIDDIVSESYTNVDFPLLIGLNIGVLQLKAGPVGHAHLSSDSDLLDIDSYEQDFKDLTWGWQAGIGIKIWRLILDVRYEKNNDEFGNHFVFNGDAYSFDDKSTRYIATVGYIF